jgi:HEAT repeat protein
MRRRVRAALASTFVLGLASSAAVQPRIANATVETRQLTRPLDVEMAALVAQGGTRWVGYRVPMTGGQRRMCCFDSVSASATVTSGASCRLERGDGIAMETTRGDRVDPITSRITIEPPAEMLVLARVENMSIVRLRTFTPDCDIDAGGMTVIWLETVRVDDSVRWLTSLARTPSNAGVKPPATVGPNSSSGVQRPAISALALHPSQTATATLVTLARDDPGTPIRSHALFWLAQRAGEEAVATIGGAIDNDPEIEVRKRAVFALSQLPRAEGVPLLINVARTHRNAEVRRQAMFWLGQSRDPRAVDFFEQILRTK